MVPILSSFLSPFLKSIFYVLPAIVGMTACHQAQLFSIEMGSHKPFLGRPGTTILPISASPVAWNDRDVTLYPSID
jgi:hypothetical protein